MHDCLPSADKLLNGHPNILRNLAEQERRDVPPRMNRHRRASPVRMAKLLVRTALPDFDKSETLKEANDLTRLEYGNVSHI